MICHDKEIQRYLGAMSVLKSYLESLEVAKLISSLSPMATPIDGRPPASAIRGLFLLAYPAPSQALWSGTESGPDAMIRSVPVRCVIFLISVDAVTAKSFADYLYDSFTAKTW